MKNYKFLFNCLFLFLSLSAIVFSANTKKAIPIKKQNSSAKKAIPVKKANPAPKAETNKSESKEIIKNIVSNCSSEIQISHLVGKPEQWLNKEICFNGVFNSFSALALDYPPALRERKKYISLTLLRPNTQIPLGELKMAMKIEEAQKHESLPKIAEGDIVKIKGKVFSTALGEPWLDIIQIQITKNPNSKNNNSSNGFDEI